MKAKVDESRIHCLDWPAIGRALLWPVVVETAFLVLLWLTSDTHGGAPHNPPSNPVAIVFMIVHLPVMLLAMPITMGLGLHPPYDAFVVVLMQVILLSYILFVRQRLNKIKIQL